MSTETKWTPGPWQATQCRDRVGGRLPLQSLSFQERGAHQENQDARCGPEHEMQRAGEPF